jgi:hypothetical protein
MRVDKTGQNEGVAGVDDLRSAVAGKNIFPGADVANGGAANGDGGVFSGRCCFRPEACGSAGDVEIDILHGWSLSESSDPYHKTEITFKKQKRYFSSVRPPSDDQIP